MADHSARILCYGDSLTWGHDPANGGLRHAISDLWPSVLAEAIPEATVLADGVNGRSTSFDDHAAPCDRNATRTLPVALAAHMPLDLVVIMLGTNDLKPKHGAVASGAQAGMRRLIQLVRGFPFKPASAQPQILIVAPPYCIAPAKGAPDGPARVGESHLFAPLYAELAEEEGVAFFDAGRVAQPSPLDGVHLDAANTRAIGAALAEPVRALLAL
ncbi:SGNH/GDSL hydrolase family protein [Alloyangia pacifica]|uniref:Lysophospholipase L1 n=1 Tax=Alloyangia pacifica TaxID=311180 RepID=A0A1I6W8V3_9RHOB|nr:SGNH/GDSL hydrolase family protein [Alloyangia pacifica]SDI45228.1 Lysophospholipase L1 [Alloyangia pacifica]SFT22400.1 Lysophospholipase L1 [Alloyangia pacifica]